MKTYKSRQEWLDQGRALFGEDWKAWVFVCPMCGNKQSVNSMLKRNITLLAVQLDNVNQHCEGLYTNGGGCGVTIKTLENHGVTHKAEVLHEGKQVPTFEFYQPEAEGVKA